MDATADTFDRAMRDWRAWQNSPWGRLRYTLAAHNLGRHLPSLGEGPLRILDLAGADGGDAVPLAGAGHHVTIADYAPGMLAAAHERARAAGAARRLTTVEADVFALPAEIAAARWDVVLCHNLLQYQREVRPALATAATLLRPGGLLSLMAINRHSVPLSLAVRGLDPVAALEALDDRDGRTVTFDAPLTLHTAEEVRAALRPLGHAQSAHYGIRTVADHITDDDRKHDPGFYAGLEALELALTDRDPYVHTARLFQLVSRAPER